MFLEKTEEKIKKNERQFKKTMIQIENLERQEKELFSQLQVSPAQLTEFLKHQDNFTEDNWKELQKQRVENQSRLNRTLDNVKDTSKLKRTYSSLKIAQHWLHVK